MKKRGQNEGSVFKRGDGRWCAVLNLGWENGRRNCKYLYGSSAAEVRAQLLKARSDHSRGIPVPLERQTVGDFLLRWLSDSVRPSVRPLTFEQYEQHFSLYLEPALGRISLPKLSANDVQRFLNRQLGSGLSPRTVQLSLVTLKRALKQAERWGLVARNVANLVDGPSVPRREIKPLDPEQSRRLLASTAGHRHEALVTTLLLCGVRLGEALALSWDDVDFAERRLAIRRSVARIGRRTEGGSKLLFQETKTARARRILHMPDTVSAALRIQRARQAQQRLSAGAEWHDLGLVFSNGLGRPLEASNLTRDFKRLLISAGLLTSIRIHDLRHSSASLLLSMGVPLKTIQEILGHSSIRVTADIYAHVAPQMLRDAADQMDSIFARTNSLVAVKAGCQNAAVGFANERKGL